MDLWLTANPFRTREKGTSPLFHGLKDPPPYGELRKGGFQRKGSNTVRLPHLAPRASVETILLDPLGSFGTVPSQGGFQFQPEV